MLHTPRLPGGLCSASTSTPRALGSPGHASHGAHRGLGTHGHASRHLKRVSARRFPARACARAALRAGEAAQSDLRGAGGSLAVSRPAGVSSRSLRPKPTLSSWDASGLNPPGAGDGGHGTPSSPPPPRRAPWESWLPLCSGLPGVQGVGKRNQLSKSGVSAPRETRGKECMRGERAGIPLAWSQGHSRSPAKLPPKLLGTALASLPAPGWGQDAQLRAGEGAGQAPHLGVCRDFARICCRR